MKKILLLGIAALTFVGCSNKDFSADYPGGYGDENSVKGEYGTAFINTFGTPAANQTWGFGTPVNLAPASRRAITVNGDVYDKFPSAEDVASAFPTSIPNGAVEVDDLLDTYKGQTVPGQWGPVTIWDIYAVYQNIVKEGFNLKITKAGTTELGGDYQNAGWNGSANVAYPYNVYVNVDGDVTLKRVGATHFNLYILKGNVTLGADYGEQAGLISVAEGATLNDQRNSIAANQGVQIYNRGTVNATNSEKYDIGNFCTVYNEGTFNVTGALTYSPGDGNTSYFVNSGDDAVLTAASMTLNSSGNFYNSGTATITGETNVTQANIYWVNAGHYTTGSMVFSAKNATFYNYCQLLVKGNAHMYDGEFNLMNNSYTEAATAEFDNFIVNMNNGAGFNVNGNTDWAAQGDGTYQGFKAYGDNAYVRLGGTTTVAGHMLSLELTGNITYAIKEIVDLGASNSGVQPTYRFNAGTTAVPFDELTVTPNATGCGATWNTGKQEENYEFLCRVFAEDLSVKTGTDFDFNDVVFDVYNKSNGDVKIVLQAAGGTLPLTINGIEVHGMFGVDTNVMVNTGAEGGETVEAKEFELIGVGVTSLADVNAKIEIKVEKDGSWYTLDAYQGKPAAKFAIQDQDVKWCIERHQQKDAYPAFEGWVQTTEPANWWKQNVKADELYTK
ncbi:MAG: hypothetical protein J1E37_05010 [Prevotella sp.]|nr:hypothetical protein [Prevotella sp.]